MKLQTIIQKAPIVEQDRVVAWEGLLASSRERLARLEAAVRFNDYPSALEELAGLREMIKRRGSIVERIEMMVERYAQWTAEERGKNGAE